MSKLIASAAVGAALLLSACSQPGPAERAGQRIDEMAENAREGRPVLQESGPTERMGRAVDDAFGKTGEQVEEAGEDMQDRADR